MILEPMLGYGFLWSRAYCKAVPGVVVSFLVVTAILVRCKEASECQVEASRDNSDVGVGGGIGKANSGGTLCGRWYC